MRKWAIGIIIGMFIASSGSLAAPNSNFTWTAPTQYEDGTMIPATDVLTYRIYCSSTTGGPYAFFWDVGSAVEANNLDVSACVQGVPGTYYFVATAFSADFATESAFSNEATKTYTNIDLGRVPLPPTLLQVQ